MEGFALALSDVSSAYPALEPPSRISVSAGAARALVIRRPGGGNGPWNPAETPYMIKPMDCLAMRRLAAVCFVGPSQSGKTMGLLDAWLAHVLCHDPGDMLMVQMTEVKANEYVKQRLNRALRYSPRMREMQSANRRDDNIYDKTFINGMRLKIGWPTASNLASTAYRYVAGTDYDRWEDDIDGEGDGFSQMRARTTTFLSRGMVVVESSPGRLLLDAEWKPSSLHEAPPVGGILGIYNTSDRQRFYWQCPHCRGPFEAEPGLGLFQLPPEAELLETIRTLDIPTFAAQHSRITCEHCGCLIEYSQRGDMTAEAAAREDFGWLEEGLTLDEYGKVSGTPRTAPVAGFWLGGVAAAYVTWRKLVETHLNALLHYAATGEETLLKTAVNTQQNAPYLSRHLMAAAAGYRTIQHDAGMLQHIVPNAARFLIAMVDVQGGRNGRFEVEVHAVGAHDEKWLITRYAITHSKREGIGGGFAPIDPAAHPEDWDVLTAQVVKATYRTEQEGVEMSVHRVAVDSGGEDGVTDRAYAWWNRLRAAGEGLHHKVRLTKGDPDLRKADWYIRETMVGGKHGKGPVPLLLVNTNRVKDVLDNRLKQVVPGPGYYHWPQPKHPSVNPGGWLPAAVLDELNAEIRNPDGKWVKVKRRNETFDLCVMDLVLCMHLGTSKPGFWVNPPAWAAADREVSTSVVTTEARRSERRDATPGAARRVRKSAYLA